jgi:alkylation response protein AidB-like acyl-CoA dehydrogenase
MTFDLSDSHMALRDEARDFAKSLEARSREIDRDATVPDAVVREARRFASGDRLAVVMAVEEIAVASGSVAAMLGAAAGGDKLTLSGLRGATAPDDSPHGHLVLCAVALGLGRAATDAGLAELRQATSRRGADVEKPHWVVADVATELEAARLLTYKAAQTNSDADIAMARVMSGAAAQRAVDAAVRVIGAEALVDGSVTERLSRDVRAVSVLLGTEEQHRATVAETLLPH